MRSRTFRATAAILTLSLLSAAPVQAGPVAISEVIQVIGNYQNPPDLRLRTVVQTGNTPVTNAGGSTVNTGVKQTVEGSDTSAGSILIQNVSDSLLTGVAVIPNDPQRGVEIIDQGEVDGTICDCGEILIPGAFPKWPLLFLAAIPLFFIDTGDDIETPTFTPTPPPPVPTPNTPQTPVPEPASLLLFGSGLAVFAAGLRRRYAKTRLATEQTAKEA
jgi:hypothetical protein